jgi:hypothetical protein
VTVLTRVFSLLMIGLGIAMIVIAFGRDDVVRGILGLLFIAAGAGRLHLQRRDS